MTLASWLGPGRRVGELELELGLLLWVWEGVAYGGMG
jgi:hypothetical protein